MRLSAATGWKRWKSWKYDGRYLKMVAFFIGLLYDSYQQ